MSIQIESGATDTAKPMVLMENFFALGTVTASTEATDAEAENAFDGNTFDFWQPTALPATFEVDMGSADTADCLAIAAHDLGTQSATLYLETFNGSTWDIEATVTPTDDSTIMVLIPATLAQRWRIRITGSTMPSIGHMALGSRIVFPGIVGDYTPTHWAETVEVLGGNSQSGQFLPARHIRKGASTTVPLGRIDRSWWETNGQAFATFYNEMQSFFFAGWPSVLSDDVALCRRMERSQELRATIVERNWVSVSFEVGAYVAT